MRRIRVRKHKRKIRKTGKSTIVKQHLRSIKTKRLRNPIKEIKRSCWNCKKPLDYEEFFDTNYECDLRGLEKLWKSDDTEFYCCSCFRAFNILKDIPEEKINEYEKSLLELEPNLTSDDMKAIISYYGDFNQLWIIESKPPPFLPHRVLGKSIRKENMTSEIDQLGIY
jgi:hypothetical protein